MSNSPGNGGEKFLNSSTLPLWNHLVPAIIRAASLGLLLTVAAVVGMSRAMGAEPIRVTAQLVREPAADQPLRLEFRFETEPGVQVYAAASHGFGIRDISVAGLGPAKMNLPATIAIPDLLADQPGATVPVFSGSAVMTVTRPATAAVGAAWKYEGEIRYQCCTKTVCFPPKTQAFAFHGVIGPTASTVTPDTVTPTPPAWGGHGLLLGMLAAFAAGLALSLTPCVYPMIGITVAVIAGRESTRGRKVWLTFWYVLGLALTYAAAGVLVALAGNRAAAFLRSGWVLAPVGVVFLLTGLSMFDLFTLAIPSGLAARLQAAGRRGSSAAGVFGMGALSAFVVGPCVTGPLVGLMTYVATTGAWLTGFLDFFALAWGMGAVLFLAGSASGWLPRAGKWMEAVKRVLGMILIWAAFLFTRPLTGETVYWAATFVCIAAGLGVLGWLRLPEKASAVDGRIWWPRLRLILGIVLLAAAAAWILNGQRQNLIPTAAGDGKVVLAAEQIAAEGKPIILEFQAPWCAICKELERTVLARPDIRKTLERYHVVKVDFDRNPELVRRFEIIGPPAFVFLKPDGTPDGATAVTAADLEQRLAGPKL